MHGVCTASAHATRALSKGQRAAAGRPRFAAARRYSAAIDQRALGQRALDQRVLGQRALDQRALGQRALGQRALGQRARLTRCWFGGPEPCGPCASAGCCSSDRTLFLAGLADPAPFTQGRLLNMFEVGLPPGETPPFAEVGSGLEVGSGV